MREACGVIVALPVAGARVGVRRAELCDSNVKRVWHVESRCL